MNNVQKFLASKLEGGVYVHIWLVNMQETYWLHEDYYTILNGKVYLIQGLKLTATGDSLESVNTKGKRIESYDPSKRYISKLKEYSFDELSKILFKKGE